MKGSVYIAALLAVTLASVLLGSVSWKKSNVQGARWLAVLLWSIALWTGMQAGSALAVSNGDKLFYHNMMYIGISLIPLAVLCFVLDYYHLLEGLNATIRKGLFVIPLMTDILVATDSYHHLFYRTVRLQEAGGLYLVTGTFNMWFWVHTAYSYLLILGTLLVLGYQLQNESGPYRRQSLQLIGAIAASSAINVLTITHVIRVEIDLTPFTFVLVGTIFYYSLFHTRVFELGPITKDLLYDTIHDGLLILDASGNVTEHNTAFLDLFAEPPGRIVGRSALELFTAYGYSTEEVTDSLNVTRQLHDRRPGLSRTWQITKNQLHSRRGPVSGTLYLFKDITEINRSLTAANEALQAAEHAKESITRTLSDMSHEIRTPLMGILGAAHQLRTDACGGEQAADAEEILAGAEELLGTVNRILDYSKLEAGKMHALQETFSLGSYLQELEALNHPPLSFTYSPSSIRTVSVRGDRSHLLQLLRLIHSFLREAGAEAVQAAVAYEKDRLIHTLRFGSLSLQAEELLENWSQLPEYLMKPWHLDPLKLVLADRLSQFMGAPLAAERVGSDWHLRFTLGLEETSPLPEPETSEEYDRPRKLLFAEDSAINQAVIRRMCKAMPWDITFADNGLSALEICRTSLFDGIFTDIHMPGLGGIDLSYSLLETINRDTPIFALTSDTDADMQAMIAKSPIRELVVKPCPKDRLIRLLQENPRIVEVGTD